MRSQLIIFLGLFFTASAFAESTVVLIPDLVDDKTEFGRNIAPDKTSAITVESDNAKDEVAAGLKLKLTIQIQMKNGSITTLKGPGSPSPSPRDGGICANTYTAQIAHESSMVVVTYQERMRTPNCEKRNLEEGIGAKSDLTLAIFEKGTDGKMHIGTAGFTEPQ